MLIEFSLLLSRRTRSRMVRGRPKREHSCGHVQYGCQEAQTNRRLASS